MKQVTTLFAFLICACFSNPSTAQISGRPSFRVIAFFQGKNDQAHISFMNEANQWFADKGKRYSFLYDTTTNWVNLNDQFLSKYDVIIFLDARPELPKQREAFRRFMERGGGWLGFHFAAFALTPSTFPQNWDWYHESFLGSGSYVSNTWRPTSAVLRMEDTATARIDSLPLTFRSAPNEWYRWQHDLRNNPDIRIIASIDSSSFPLGTGPKKHEIWTEGYYPVVWSNIHYRMVYFNMGHNDIDYEGGTNNTLSSTFQSAEQCQLILTELLRIGNTSGPRHK